MTISPDKYFVYIKATGKIGRHQNKHLQKLKDYLVNSRLFTDPKEGYRNSCYRTLVEVSRSEISYCGGSAKLEINIPEGSIGFIVPGTIGLDLTNVLPHKYRGYALTDIFTDDSELTLETFAENLSKSHKIVEKKLAKKKAKSLESD